MRRAEELTRCAMPNRLPHRIALIVMIVASFCLSLSFRSLAQESTLAADQNSDIALAWMDLTYRLVQNEAVNAPAASRIYAYAGVTLYEAVVNGMPDNSSLASQINSMPEMPLPADGHVYDWSSSANGAMAKVLLSIFVDPSEET